MKTNIVSPRGLGLIARVFRAARNIDGGNQQEKKHIAGASDSADHQVEVVTNIRERVLTAAIVSLMALSACVSAQEKATNDAKLKQLRAEVEARLAAEREARKHRELNSEAMVLWVQTYREYLLKLCRTPSGEEHTHAWENYQIAVSTDEFHAGDAGEIGRLVGCSALEENEPKDRSTGYIWSNQPDQLSGFTWSNIQQRDRRHG